MLFEASPRASDAPDVCEVANYVRALEFGVREDRALPISLRLIREIHGELMAGVRGTHLTPEEFRTSQNWIGPPVSTAWTELVKNLFKTAGTGNLGIAQSKRFRMN